MKQYKTKYFLSLFLFLTILFSPLSAQSIFPIPIALPSISSSNTCQDLDDERRNNQAPGKVISDLDGITQDAQSCIYGDSAHDDKDYYTFTIAAEGNLTITTSSPNNREYHFMVKVNGEERFPDVKLKNRTIFLPLEGNLSTVVIYIKETGRGTDEYRVDFNFTQGPVGDVLIGKNRPFTIRNPIETRNIAGNYAIIGNSNLCAIDSENSNAPWQGECIQDSDNDKAARYIDIDNDPTTKNSSTSTLNISADFSQNGGARVVWAGLYWQGVVHNSLENGDFMGDSGEANGITIENEPFYSESKVALNFTESSSLYDANKIKFKLPGSNSYIDITADVFDFYKLGYSGFKDVTTLIQNLPNPNGIYGVADIKTHQGVERAHGNFGAWGLVVIYEDPHESFRNITLFDGYVTVDSHYEEDLVMNGFLTPRKTPINSKLAMFVMDGDNGDNGMEIENQAGEVTYVQNQDNPNNSLFDSTISSSIERNPSATSLRTDLKVLDLVDVLNPLETEATLKPRSGGDRYTPSFFIMSAELIRPKLCYDYAYQQDNRYFTEENNGSLDPHIKGKLFSSNNIAVSLFIRNKEDSDFTIQNLTTSVVPIDTTQATYVDNSTEAILPGETLRHPVTPANSDEGAILDAPIGTIKGNEFFYFYYDLEPKGFEIDMPMNIYLDYNATFNLPNGTVVELPPYHQQVNRDIPMCVEGNFSYAPVYGIFNVEQQGLNAYNIYTQIARRVDNFEIKAYDANDLESTINVEAAVAIELIDAGAYHETQTSCQEPDTALTPRIWMLFENQESINFTQNEIDEAIFQTHTVKHGTLNQAEEFYAVARQNSAFRVSVVTDSNGSILQVVKDASGHYSIRNLSDQEKLTIDMGNGAGKCGNDATQTISNKCPDTMPDKEAVAECMECLYDYNLKYICSRDNFAIRPHAFKISLNDDNTSVVVSDFANNTNLAGSRNAPVNLVAGYPYRFDINATSYTNENGVVGYTQRFANDTPDRRAAMVWDPDPLHITTACNAPEDQNMSFSMIGGTNTNPNPINTWADRHDALDNVGEYQFIVSDEEWTKYDWDPRLIQHHNKPHFLQNQLEDCIVNDTSVGTVGTPSGRSGCLISSQHLPSYHPLYIRAYPYAIDTTQLQRGARPQRASGNTFVYVNTLDPYADYPYGFQNITDHNMSYNIGGTLTAKGYSGNILTNFVDQCYADDLTMQLRYRYLDNSGPDAQHPFKYELHTPVTGENFADVPADNKIDLTAANFLPGQQGSSTIDLGYNFDRDMGTPFDPIYMSIEDYNLSYKTQPTTLYAKGVSDYHIESRLPLDQNITFIYGRAMPNRFLYDSITSSSVQTPVSIAAYCSLGLIGCQNRGLPVIASGLLQDAQSASNNWWFVQQHDQTQNDGDILLQASTGGSVTPQVIPTDGIDGSVTVTNTSGATPHSVDIDLTTPDTARWLIFNKGSNTIPQPFYRVRFIGSSGWTGRGKTGHVVGDDINTKAHKKVEW